MGGKSSTIILTQEEHEYLKTQTCAARFRFRLLTVPVILLLKAYDYSMNDIVDKVGLNHKSVMLCINKYVDGSVENALFDAPGCGCSAEITDEETAWINKIASQKPVDFGYAAETWLYA